VIEEQPVGPLSHLGVSAHIPDGIGPAVRAWLEERRAEATEYLLDEERASGPTTDLEDFIARETREQRRRREARLSDGMHSYCCGCGKLRALWELDMVRVPAAELPPGAPLTLRMICKRHGVPAVAAPAHEWQRIAVQDPSREQRDAEAIRHLDELLAELGGAEALIARRVSREYPPARPMPNEVPTEMTVGFWRRMTGRRGKG
jgi:hypothetical protein